MCVWEGGGGETSCENGLLEVVKNFESRFRFNCVSTFG